jgi:hypothetical protein
MDRTFNEKGSEGKEKSVQFRQFQWRISRSFGSHAKTVARNKR